MKKLVFILTIGFFLSLSFLCMFSCNEDTKEYDTTSSNNNNNNYLTYYKEPYILWNSSKSEIKQKESRNIKSENNNELVYFGENIYCIGVAYFFENNKLIGAGSAHSLEYWSQILNQLRSEYEEIGTDIPTGTVVFNTFDGKTTLGIRKQDGKVIVAYAPLSKSQKGITYNIYQVFDIVLPSCGISESSTILL